MIPKVIHYIWLGGNPLPELVQKCIDSWKKYCPDYEIKRWDESNLDLNKYQFALDAYNAKKYAFASDAFRYDVLYEHGGIYLDVDVELFRSLDDFLDLNYFTGFEDDKFLNPGLIMGAEKKNSILKNIIEIYKQEVFDVNKLKTICFITTDYFADNFENFKADGKTQKLENGVTIFSKDFFCPKNYKTGEINITKNTCSIHHYLASWIEPLTFGQKVKQKFKNVIKFIIGKKNTERIKNKMQEKKNEKQKR